MNAAKSAKNLFPYFSVRAVRGCVYYYDEEVPYFAGDESVRGVGELFDFQHCSVVYSDPS